MGAERTLLRPYIFVEIFGKREKRVYNLVKCVYNNNTTKYGDAPDSIAGERKNKHAVEGKTTLKRST